jgi:hypothetical protein
MRSMDIAVRFSFVQVGSFPADIVKERFASFFARGGFQ